MNEWMNETFIVFSKVTIINDKMFGQLKNAY